MIRFPPRRIMVGFDLSVLSISAWRNASALAKRTGAEVELVYVEPGLSTMGGRAQFSGLSDERKKKIARDIRAKVGEGPRITVLEGGPAASLLRAARSCRADMIVVGTHARRGLSRIMLGSVAEAVILSSPVPVLVVRGRTREYRAILAPVNFTSYSNHGFAFAAGVSKSLGARLTALHVSVDPISGGNALLRLRRLKETLPAGARCEERIVFDEDVARGIRRASAKHDLIVLTAHKRSVLEDVLLGVTAEKVLRSSSKPLLVVPPANRHIRAIAELGKKTVHQGS